MAGMSGCLGGSGSDSSGTFELALGTILSGSSASIGRPARAAVQLAVKDLNENQGGINGEEINLHVFDTEASPQTAVTRVREINSKTDLSAVVGLSGSSVGFALGEFCSNNELVHMAGGQSQDFSGSKCHKTTFMPQPNVIHTVRAGAKSLVENTDVEINRVAGINPNYSYGEQSWNTFKEKIKELKPDVEIVSELLPEFGKGEYEQEITTTLDADPDIVFSTLWSGSMISFIQQAHQYNFFDQTEFMITGAHQDVVRSLGSEMPEFFAGIGYTFVYPDTEMNNNFVDEFISYHGAVPGNNAHIPYANTFALKSGAEESGDTSRDGLISGMEGLEFEAPGSTVTIRANDHQGIYVELPTGWLRESPDYDFKVMDEVYPIDAEEVAEDPGTCSF
jgi:branched-chain amino acid transport system substrate-binding protein